MKVESKNNEADGDKLGFAFKSLTLFASLLAVLVAILTYKLNRDDDFNKQKNEEVSTFSRSVECSLSHCGAMECSNIYTIRYPRGDYYKTAIQAAESGKALLSCSSPKDIQNALSRTINQTGKANQFNQGGHNYQSVQ